MNDELARAWDDGFAAGMRREFEVMAHIRAGEPSPKPPRNPYAPTDRDRNAA